MITRRKFINLAVPGAAAVAFFPFIGASQNVLAQAKSPEPQPPVSTGTEDPKPPGAIDRLYALNGGFAVAPDRSAYSPGKWKGEQVTLSCNAYLLRRRDE